MKASKALLVLACWVGVAVAQSPGPDPAVSLARIEDLGLTGVAWEAMTARGPMVQAVPVVKGMNKLRPVSGIAEHVPLRGSSAVNGTVAGWTGLSSKAAALDTGFVPSFPIMERFTSAVDLANVRPGQPITAKSIGSNLKGFFVRAMEKPKMGKISGVAGVKPLRQGRKVDAPWHLVPFQVGRHTPMGENIAAVDAALLRGDGAESDRLRREYWRICEITVARREAFSKRPAAGRRGGNDD